MTEAASKRMVGRIDKLYHSKDGDSWGYLVTEDWKEFFWHSNEVHGRPRLHNVVAFDPVASEGERPAAVNIKIISRKQGAENFGEIVRRLKRKLGAA